MSRSRTAAELVVRRAMTETGHGSQPCCTRWGRPITSTGSRTATTPTGPRGTPTAVDLSGCPTSRRAPGAKPPCRARGARWRYAAKVCTSRGRLVRGRARRALRRLTHDRPPATPWSRATRRRDPRLVAAAR
jgi:hypothetical protein